MAKQKTPISEDLGRNLQLLMTLKPELGSQMLVAKKAGISQSTVGRILRGEVTPSVDAVMNLSKTFGVALYDLYQPHETFAALARTESQHGLHPSARTPSALSAFKDRGLVPLIDWKQALGISNPPSVKEWVICPVPINDSVYALEVKGLGMFDPAGPLSFREKDRIFVDQKRQAQHRSLVIVHLANAEEASFRQLLNEEGKWFLLQLNPSLPQRMVALDSGSRVLGVVVAKVEKYD